MNILEDLGLESFIRLHIKERDHWSFGDAHVAAHLVGLERILKEVGIPEQLSKDEWLHFVAAPRINNEALTPWMAEFQAWLWNSVQGLDGVEKILRVNELAAAEVTYQSSNARTLPPPALKRGIYGRCGEESTFVTAALRSVGIPARQVYAPLWNHSDDNHAWVEAFDGETWRFLGACEPEAILDVGWFNAAASRAPLVVSRTQVARSNFTGYELGLNSAGQYLQNESHRYREGARLKFSVPTDEEGLFSIHLLNYSHLAPLLEVVVKNLNEFELDLGAGTYLMSFETVSGRYASSLDLLTLEEKSLELVAESWRTSLENLPRHWHASRVSRPVPEIPDEAREKGLYIRTKASARRQAKEDAQVQHAQDIAKDRTDVEKQILIRSRGNVVEVEKLLNMAMGDESILQLLINVPQKDLYELVAEDYFRELTVVQDAARDLEPKLRAETLLNPRVHAEDFSSYRSCLYIELKKPDEILDAMRVKYPITEQALAVYEPLTVLARQEELSLRDFTKLLCGTLRAHGYPSIYKSVGYVEVYDEGEWRGLSLIEYSSLKLVSSDPEYVWRSGQNYQLMNFDAAPSVLSSGLGAWNGASDVIELIGRKFAVITTVRLPNGDQRCEVFFTEVIPGEVTELELRLPQVSSEELLIDVPLPSEAITKALQLGDGAVGLAVLTQGGNEPTEHAFEELALLWDGIWNRLDEVTFYYDAKRDDALESLERSPRYMALKEKGLEAEIRPLNYAAHLEALGRGLFVEPEALPLILLYENKENTIHVRFAFAGYTVGLGERILNSLEEIRS